MWCSSTTEIRRSPPGAWPAGTARGCRCARGLHDGGYGLSIVVDFIELGGVPGCWPGELLGWCARDAGSCAPLSSRRLCLEIAVDGGDPTALSAELGKRLKNESITNDAPDEPVLIRLVATAQGCDQLRQVTQPFADQSLIGCMISCPVQLDTVQKVALGLPTFTDDCEQAVQVCAAPRLGRP